MSKSKYALINTFDRFKSCISSGKPFYIDGKKSLRIGIGIYEDGTYIVSISFNSMYGLGDIYTYLSENFEWDDEDLFCEYRTAPADIAVPFFNSLIENKRLYRG